MNKLFLYFCFTIIVSTGFGQTRLGDSLEITEYNFFYKDSVDNEVSFGNYEPTGCVSLNDGSIIVTTRLSIFFNGQYKSTDTINAAYFSKQKRYSAKSHVSSGTIFKLNHNFEKEWEIIMYDKRVVSIKKLPDETMLVIGERVDQKLFWIARIDPHGITLHEKEFYFKHEPDIENIEIDSLGNAYVLVRCERKRIIETRGNVFKGRLTVSLFKLTEFENDLYLLKISPKGKLLWKTPLDKRTHFSAYGKDLLVDNNIYVSSSFEGFVKKKDQYIRQEGNLIYEIDCKGNILHSYPSGKIRLFNFKHRFISCTSEGKDTFIVNNEPLTHITPIDTLIFADDVTHFWIHKSIHNKTYNYLLGGHNYSNGCLVLELNIDNTVNGYWKDSKMVYSALVDAVIKPDNSLVILSKGYGGTDEDFHSYINISNIKNKNSSH